MKRFHFLVVLLPVFLFATSCENAKETTHENETGSIVTRITFEGTAKTRAGSTSIPPTSWENIESLQLFLYEANTGNTIVRFSDDLNINTGLSEQTYMWTNVPAGTYTLALVANVKSDRQEILTSMDKGNTFQVWDPLAVRGRSAETQLGIYLKEGTFPKHSSGVIYPDRKAKVSPPEIFMAYHSDNVTIVNGGTVTITNGLKLKREVALMRVRLCIDPTYPDTWDAEFAADDASIIYHRIPDGMSILKGEDGGVYMTSDQQVSVVAATGSKTFLSEGDNLYGNGTITDSRFDKWRDIVIFPNMAVDGSRKRTSEITDTDRQYTIVVSAEGQEGHTLANGQKLSEPTTVYWSGLISEPFLPNKIREVNLTIQTGGQIDPPNVREEGTLEITVGEPEDWSSNIDVSDLDL